jgi:hypothetical protein
MWSLRGLRRGLKKKSLRVIYPALCVSTALTALLCGTTKVTTVHNKRTIDAAQRGFLLLLTTAWRTASTDVLQVLAGVLPLDLEVIRAAANWHVKRGLEFQLEDLRVQRIPPDCPDDMRLRLASSMRKAVEQWLMTTWQTRWYSSEKGRTTFSWIQRVRLPVSAGWGDFSREVICLLTGHGHFNKMVFSLGLSDTPSFTCLLSSKFKLFGA